MTDYIAKFAEDETLQEKVKACKDAKEFAALMEMDETQAAQVFPKVKELLASGTVPEELLKDVSGGCCSELEPCYIDDPE